MANTAASIIMAALHTVWSRYGKQWPKSQHISLATNTDNFNNSLSLNEVNTDEVAITCKGFQLWLNEDQKQII